MDKEDIWKEGRYLDVWSINHFLSGVIFTGWMQMLHFNNLLIFLVYMVLAIGWEVFEILRKIHEYTGNKIMDVVTGGLGFVVVYAFYTMGQPMSLLLLIISTIVYILLEIQGFISYKRREIGKNKTN